MSLTPEPVEAPLEAASFLDDPFANTTPAPAPKQEAKTTDTPPADPATPAADPATPPTPDAPKDEAPKDEEEQEEVDTTDWSKEAETYGFAEDKFGKITNKEEFVNAAIKNNLVENQIAALPSLRQLQSFEASHPVQRLRANLFQAEAAKIPQFDPNHKDDVDEVNEAVEALLDKFTEEDETTGERKLNRRGERQDGHFKQLLQEAVEADKKKLTDYHKEYMKSRNEFKSDLGVLVKDFKIGDKPLTEKEQQAIVNELFFGGYESKISTGVLMKNKEGRKELIENVLWLNPKFRNRFIEAEVEKRIAAKESGKVENNLK